MNTKKTPKDEVELVLKVLHQQINALKQKVEELCKSTGKCEVPENDGKFPTNKQR
jgi:hypothetical protein